MTRTLYRGLLVTLSAIVSVALPAKAALIDPNALLHALLAYCGYVLTEQD